MKRALDYLANSRRRMIALLAESGKTQREAYSIFRPMVISQIAPMIFKMNNPVKGMPRIPKASIREQLVDLKHEINRVYAEMALATLGDFESDESDASGDDSPIQSDDEIESEDSTDSADSDEEDSDDVAVEDEDEVSDDDEDDSTDEIPTPEIAPVAAGKGRIRRELAYFIRRVREIRAECNRRAEMSELVDSISMRPAQAAARLIPVGIPADCLLHSMTIHWGEDTRQSMGISHFDVLALSREINRQRGITTVTRWNGNVEQVHDLFGYILTLAENRLPIMLVGPPGTGKSHICGQIADYLFPGQREKYGETPMSAGATRGDLLGRLTASKKQPFISAMFSEMYVKGGVFNHEEFDACDPSLAIVLNNALASDHFYNSNSGKMLQRHADFIPMATANTWGLGATSQHSARERLDSATVDRWRMARVWMDLDEALEDAILYSVVGR